MKIGLTMEDKNPIIEKIQDQELQKFAFKNTDEETSVIIVLDLPESRLDFEEKTYGSNQMRVPFSFAEETNEEKFEIEEKTAEAKSFLEGVLGDSPHHLQMAQAFVATVNNKQLNKIVSSPLIKSVYPNRILK